MNGAAGAPRRRTIFSMTGRRIRRLLILAAIVGVAYWIYKDQPTVSGLVDSMVGPLMGSRAAVKSSERNRVTGDATAAITEQSDAAVGTLHEGMTTMEVRDLLGESRENRRGEAQARRQGAPAAALDLRQDRTRPRHRGRQGRFDHRQVASAAAAAP